MSVIVRGYNHNAARFMSGANAVGDTYKVMLLSPSATFDATHTTMNQVSSSGAYEVSGNGWTAGGETLTNVSVSTINTDDAKWDADDVSVLIIGGALTFRHYVIFNATDTDSPPLAFIERTANMVFAEDAYGQLVWPAAGIMNMTYTAP